MMIPLWLNLLQIELIASVQNSFMPYDQVLFWFSFLGDPRNCFLITFPICSAWSGLTGYRILWISALAESCNAVLKWIFLDDRPYWWIYEHSRHIQNVTLTQFPATCETGPGFPSGHVMAISSTGLLITLVLNQQLRLSLGRLSASILSVGVWILYIGVVVAVCLCRIFLAAHFPHQVIVAVFVGCSITMVVLKMSTFSGGGLIGAAACIYGSLAMAIVAAGTYFLLILAGVDPLSTVAKAFLWCHNRSWVHIDTTPFFSLSRDIGAVFGLGIATFCQKLISPSNNIFYSGTRKNTVSSMSRCFVAMACLMFSFLVENVPVPSYHTPTIMYIIAFVKFALIPLFVLGIMPIVVNKLFSAHKKSL